ncbi:MAG: SHOCT domain-containing protein [Chloroflexota bacterium]
MRAFRIVLGILLMFIAFAALFLIVLLPTMQPESPFVLNMLASIACDPGQKAEVEVRVSHDNEGNGYTPILTCIGREGERIDASDKHLSISVITFIVPFLLGLFLVIIGAGRNRRKTPKTVWMPGSNPQQVGFSGGAASSSSTFSSGGTVFNTSSPKIEVKDGVLNVDGIEIRMDGLKPEHLKMFEGMSTPIVMSSSMSTSGAATLAAKLKEIQEARDSGLITNAEYDKLRQEILDKLT